MTNPKSFVEEKVKELEEKYHFKFNSCHHGRVADSLENDIRNHLTQTLIEGLKLAKENLPEERIIHGYMKDQDGKPIDYCNGWNDFRIKAIKTLSAIDQEINKLENHER